MDSPDIVTDWASYCDTACCFQPTEQQQQQQQQVDKENDDEDGDEDDEADKETERHLTGMGA